MNERIKQLERQAIIDVLNGNDPDGDVDRMYISAEFTKKFAQLIVKECSKVCNDVGVAIFAEPVQNNFGTAQTCKLAIEQHFGVEL